MNNFTFSLYFKKLLCCFSFLLLLAAVNAQVPVISGGVGQTNNNPNNAANGGDASGLGCGGGGANFYGGDGGNGLFGGGGGGAAGFTAVNMTGGAGGQGVVVAAFYNGAVFLYSNVYTTGSSFTVGPLVTSVKVWAIGAGGGGAGSTDNDGTVGGGAGAGGTAYITRAVTQGDIVTYSLGVGGAGGTDANNGSNGDNTTATVAGTTITGFGGAGGEYNNDIDAAGGSYSGGDGGMDGGSGKGSSGDTGGGGGGGIGNAIGGTPGSDGANGADASDVSGLFAALSIGTILPIEWKSFIVTNQKDGALLQWETSFELNALSFTVQYSTDGIRFTNTGTVAAANNINGHAYQYLHADPQQQTGYYRLYQTGTDGKISYSSIIRNTVQATDQKDIVLNGSNIINSIIRFQLNRKTVVEILSMDGRLVYSRQLEKGSNEINAGGLSTGYYILRTSTGMQKILIQ